MFNLCDINYVHINVHVNISSDTQTVISCTDTCINAVKLFIASDIHSVTQRV